jgi:hypothetical protein
MTDATFRASCQGRELTPQGSEGVETTTNGIRSARACWDGRRCSRSSAAGQRAHDRARGSASTWRRAGTGEAVPTLVCYLRGHFDRFPRAIGNACPRDGARPAPHRSVAKLKNMSTWTDRLGSTNLRTFTDAKGHFWLEQNPAKRSKWGKLARQGHEMAWEFARSHGEYTGRMLIDGEITTPAEATKKFLLRRSA